MARYIIMIESDPTPGMEVPGHVNSLTEARRIVRLVASNGGRASYEKTDEEDYGGGNRMMQKRIIQQMMVNTEFAIIQDALMAVLENDFSCLEPYLGHEDEYNALPHHREPPHKSGPHQIWRMLMALDPVRQACVISAIKKLVNDDMTIDWINDNLP